MLHFTVKCEFFFLIYLHYQRGYCMNCPVSVLSLKNVRDSNWSEELYQLI